jgi:ABC-type branched-subunit amino acid transport system ATPase component
MPPWFPFQFRYWFPSRAAAPQADKGNDDDNAGIPYEPVGDALKRQQEENKTIEVHRLRKVFGEKTAVDGLTLSMYSGQITALLGHNGAGKTTTISLLTGALEATEGYATVFGKDTRTQMNEIRQDIGICLQHDCLFPLLTVREHIQFFSRVKGLYAQLPFEKAEEQVDQVIQDVALSDKRSTLSSKLSGGMKRKLSLAIAFSGGSKVVVLDEVSFLSTVIPLLSSFDTSLYTFLTSAAHVWYGPFCEKILLECHSAVQARAMHSLDDSFYGRG